MTYYKAVVRMGHAGSGRHTEQTVYKEARDVDHLREIISTFGGVKKKGTYQAFLDVIPITKEEYFAALEEKLGDCYDYRPPGQR
jgi:hypothetical protein